MEFHKTLLCHSPFPLSLYIHIPFCVKKCFYCDFYSIPYDKNKAEYIINELILEIRFFFRTFSHIKIRTIYIGGGTPSCLSLQYLEKLLISCKDDNYTTLITNRSGIWGGELELYIISALFNININCHFYVKNFM